MFALTAVNEGPCDGVEHDADLLLSLCHGAQETQRRHLEPVAESPG